MTDLDLSQAARKLQAARTRLDLATKEAADAAVAAINSGASEVYVASALGVNRLTVRRWLGK